MTKKEILGLATTLWGEINQRNQLQEELTELDLAICKLRRTGNEEKKMDNFFEEIADVKIMIEQMEHIYGAKEIDGHYEKKLNRLEERLKEVIINTPIYNSIYTLLQEEIISKYFNTDIKKAKLLSGNETFYITSKDGIFSIYSMYNNENMFSLYNEHKKNLNKERLSLYFKLDPKEVFDVDKLQLLKTINYLYNDKEGN